MASRIKRLHSRTNNDLVHEMSKRIQCKRKGTVHLRHFNFRKGDVVEWIEWKQGTSSKHEGEIVGNGGLYKHIYIGSDASIGDVRVTHRLRTDYYTVMDFADNNTFVLHGSRLSRCKVKVSFN